MSTLDSTALSVGTRVVEALALPYHPAAAQDTASAERFPGQLAHKLGYREHLSLPSEGWQKRTSPYNSRNVVLAPKQTEPAKAWLFMRPCSRLTALPPARPCRQCVLPRVLFRVYIP